MYNMLLPLHCGKYIANISVNVLYVYIYVHKNSRRNNHGVFVPGSTSPAASPDANSLDIDSFVTECEFRSSK